MLPAHRDRRTRTYLQPLEIIILIQRTVILLTGRRAEMNATLFHLQSNKFSEGSKSSPSFFLTYLASARGGGNQPSRHPVALILNMLAPSFESTSLRLIAPKPGGECEGGVPTLGGNPGPAEARAGRGPPQWSGGGGGARAPFRGSSVIIF